MTGVQVVRGGWWGGGERRGEGGGMGGTRLGLEVWVEEEKERKRGTRRSKFQMKGK